MALVIIIILTVIKAGARRTGQAGSSKKKKIGEGWRGRSLSSIFFSLDPARPAPAFSIVSTDRKPGTQVRGHETSGR